MDKTRLALVFSMFLLVGILVFGKFSGSIDRGDFSTELNESFDNAVENTTSGFDLGSNIPLVLFASIILAAIVGFAVGKMRGG